MRLNKLAKKIFAAGLAVSLMMANAGIGFAGSYPAEKQATGTKFEFNKYLILDSNAKVPNAVIEFDIVKGTAVPKQDGKMGVYEGVGTPTIASVTFAPSDTMYTTKQGTDDITLPEGKSYAKQKVTVDFTNVTFAEPGVYRYNVTEKDPANTAITKDSATKYLDVYVIDTEGTLSVGGYTLHTTTDAPDVNTSTSGTAGGSLADKTDGFTNTFESHDLYIKKAVEGNQASRDKYFKFTVTLSGTAGTTFNVDISNAASNTGETASTAAANQNKANPTTITIPEGSTEIATDFYLSHDDYIIVRGLAEGTTYAVTEDAEDYTPAAAAADGFTDAASGTMQKTDIKTSYKNTRQGTIPTGVILDSAPFILIIGLAAAALIFTAARKKVR